MLVQIGDDIWVDPMKVISVFATNDSSFSEEYPTTISIEGKDTPLGSKWPVSMIVEQLNGRKP